MPGRRPGTRARAADFRIVAALRSAASRLCVTPEREMAHWSYAYWLWGCAHGTHLAASRSACSILGTQAPWPLRARRHHHLGPRAALPVLRPQPGPNLICLYEEKVLPRRLGRRQRGGRLAAQEFRPPGPSHNLTRREREGGLVLRAAPSATSSAVPSAVLRAAPSATSSAVPSAIPL